MSKRIFTVLFFSSLLWGCSSAPEPTPMDWTTPPSQLNESPPVWAPNITVVPATGASGHWQFALNDVQGDEVSYSPAFWYSVAHARRIIVSASQNADWFATRDWLRAHGAKPVIEYRLKVDCLTCHSVDVYLAR